MAEGEPFGNFFCLERQVVFASADFDLNRFHFGAVRFFAGRTALLLFSVLEFAVVSYFGDRRIGIRRYFNQIQPSRFGLAEGVSERHDAEILSGFIDDAELRRLDLMIDAYLACQLDSACREDAVLYSSISHSL